MRPPFNVALWLKRTTVFFAAFLAVPAHAGFLYEIHLVGSPYRDGKDVEISVRGFIEVSDLGPVTVEDIIDYRLMLSTTEGPTYVTEDFSSTWTPSNSFFVFADDISTTSALVATETELYIPPMTPGSGHSTRMDLIFEGSSTGAELDDCNFSTLVHDECTLQIFGTADGLDRPVAYLEYGFKDVTGDEAIAAAREGYNVFGDQGEPAVPIVIGTLSVPLFRDGFETGDASAWFEPAP